jgi:cell division protein FtsQ
MMKFMHMNEQSRRRAKQVQERRFSSNVASHTLIPKSKGRRLKGDRRKAAAGEPVSPPVMARAARITASGAQVRQKRPLKRRYDISLGVTGAEARLPTMPVVSFSWRFVSGAMFLLMALCVFNLWSSPAFKIDTIQVDGENRLSQGDINTVLGIIGESIFLVTPQELEENLLTAFPELTAVDIDIALPADVLIKIEERKPVMSLIYKDVEYWIDSEGVAFAPRGNPGKLIRVETQSELADIQQSDQADDSPLLTPRITVNPDLVSAVQNIGGTLPEDTLILYDQEHGLGWNDPQGWQVYFGQDTQDIEMKLVVYEALVESLVEEGVYPAMISVEYVHAPYFRMEQ